MRRLVVLVAALMLGHGALWLAAARPAAAQPALVFDMDNGEVLLAEEAGRPWYPASLTKLMTAYLTLKAVRAGRLSLNTVATISRRAAAGGGHGAARLGVKPGTRMTIDRMLAFLLVRSDADMAVALAEAVGGSEAAFVSMMNAAARHLGMTGTHFVNPHGMGHPRQVTTARDMGLLAMAIYHEFLKRNPALWRYFSAPYIRKGKKKQKNRNKLLFMMKGANGMKTGFLCASGFNLLATARRGGHQLAAVVFGRKTGYTRASFARVMLEEGFRMLRAGRHTGISIRRIPNHRGKAPDISAGVCKGRSIRMADFATLGGWGVAIGAARASVRAEALLEAEMLAARLWRRKLPHGVARLPRERAYAGLVWNLAEEEALGLCMRARAHGVACEAYPPQALARLARAVEEQRRLRQKKRSKAAGKASGRKRKMRFTVSPARGR